MWYVIQVRTGTEEKIRRQCETQIDREILTRCFIPYYETKRKVNGNWRIQSKVLFPGYVFAITDELGKLQTALHSIRDLTKLIGAGRDVIPLRDNEVRLLQKLGGEEQTVRLSEGIIEGGEIIISQGPLSGMEGSIKKIDRHKRKAWIEVEMFGRMQMVEVGLEIVEKK